MPTTLPKNNLYFVIYSISLASFLGVGAIGYGIDVKLNYLPGKIVSYSIFDSIGQYLASLRLGSLYLGVFIASFLMIFSVALLYSVLLKLPILNTSFLLLPLIFSWPMILPSLNALRQGICTGFFFLALSTFLAKDISKLGNKILLGLLILLTLYSHKVGFILVASFLLVFLYRLLFIIRLPNLFRVGIIFSALCASLSIYLLLNYRDYGSRVVGLDLTPALLPFLVLSCFLTFNNLHKSSNDKVFCLKLQLTFLSLFAFIFSLFGFSFQSERLFMLNILLILPILLSRMSSKSLKSACLGLVGCIFVITTVLAMPFYTYLSFEF